jgi:hypothetical protein
MFGKLFLAALSCAFAANAAAATQFFVQARGGVAEMDDFRIEDEEGIGQLLVGARWGGFGVEIGYLATGTFSDHFVSQRIAGFELDYADEVDGWFVGLNGRCALAEGPWHVSGRVGALQWDIDRDIVANRGPALPLSEFDAEDTGLYVAAGVDRDIGERFSVGAALEYFRLDSNDEAYSDASMRALVLTLEYRL